MGQLDELIAISRFYGDNPDYVIAGGGNTSMKDRDRIWIKASGIPLAGIGPEGFVSLSREKLAVIESKSYSSDPVEREGQVKSDLTAAILAPGDLRPSVETSLHNLIGYTFVIHTHPTRVNALMCSRDAGSETKKRFGEEALYMEYTDPGFILFKQLQRKIEEYRKRHSNDPRIIFLQNHGVFVGADRVKEVRKLYDDIDSKLNEGTDLDLPACEPEEDRETHFAGAALKYFQSRGRIAQTYTCELIRHFTRDKAHLMKVSRPFTPDMIVYCKSNYLIVDKGVHPDSLPEVISSFESENGYLPRIILQEGGGMTVVEESEKSLRTAREVFLDLMKISYLSEQFGGPHFMTDAQIRFIDNWEVEHYRRKVARG